MGRWKEEMEVEFVKLSNRVEALEKLMQEHSDAREKLARAGSVQQTILLRGLI